MHRLHTRVIGSAKLIGREKLLAHAMVFVAKREQFQS
jgi:hypothetical protein